MRLVIIYACLSLASMLGCNRTPQWESFGPGAKANLVIVFKQGTSQKEINSFLGSYLFDKAPGGKGDWPKAGIGAVVLVTVQGHVGYSVRFTAEATPERQRAILKRVDASPVVLRVFQNVAPRDIKLVDDLPAGQRQLES